MARTSHPYLGMSAHQEQRHFDPTYIRPAHERLTSSVDLSVEATIIDNLPPALRQMIEREMKAVDDHTSIGKLVDRTQDVLMTAHLPSDLSIEDMLDEDLASERRSPWDGEPGAIEPVVGPVKSFPEPRTVHSYVELDLPAAKPLPAEPRVPPAADTKNLRLRAKTPVGGRDSDQFLVRPVELARRAHDAVDPYDLSAIAGAFQPLAFGADDTETKTNLRAFHVDDTSTEDVYDSTDRASFSTPAPRGAATARGVGPQRYIPTIIGQNPLPKVGQTPKIDVPGAVRLPSRVLVATFGIACLALMMVQVL